MDGLPSSHEAGEKLSGGMWVRPEKRLAKLFYWAGPGHANGMEGRG